LYYNGKAVYKRADGTLVDENNVPVLTKDGKRVLLTDDNQLVDEDNTPITVPLLTDASGAYVTNSNLSSGIEATDVVKGLSPLLKNGEPIFYKGEPVYKRADGTLVDANNQPITTSDGRVIKLNENGELTDSTGKLITSKLLTDGNGEFVSTIGFDSNKPKKLLMKDGVPVLIDGKQAFVDSNGNLVDEYDHAFLGADGKPLLLNDKNEVVDSTRSLVNLDNGADGITKNAGFKVKRRSAEGKFGFVDGYLLDANGKPITHNGQKVIRGQDGFLYTEDGKRIETADGSPVSINSKGEFIDADGNVIDEALFEDGEGTLLYGNGKPVTTLMKQIGDSDLYVTRDGKIVTKDGKAYRINGKGIKINPKTGQLMDEDNNPIRDENGNSVMLSETGKFINRKGELVKNLGIVDDKGRLLTSSGKLITKSNDLTAIPGTSYFKTPDGAVVDAEGKPVLLNGKMLYVDELGRITDAAKRQHRFLGQRIATDTEGYIVDSKNERILVNNQPVKLDDISSLEKHNEESDGEQTFTNDQLIPTPSNEVKPTQNIDETQSNEDDAEKTKEQVQVSASLETDTSNNESVVEEKIDLTTSSYNDRERLASRFNSILAKLNDEQSEIIAKASPTYVSSSQYIELPESDNSSKGSRRDTNMGTNNPDGNKKDAPKDDPKADLEMLYGAGDNLFAISTQEMNSDYNSELEVEILSGSKSSPVYLAKAYAKVELRYDNAVLVFNRICPLKSECLPLSGMGLDPVTGSAGMAADVDYHYWYRYGGLFLAQFGSGVSEGISDSIDTETETVSTATTTSTVSVISGLDYGDIALKGLADTGDAFIPSLSERVNRPITATIPSGTEIVIKLSAPLYL
jgi:hypothetical protein